MNASPHSAWLALAVASHFAIGVATASPRTLDDLSLQDLTSLRIDAPTRVERSESAVASAAFVLTQDDIRRAGATSIPHALRLVPGLQVAQVDGNRWAISARGFNSRMSNRILVLIDGRSLYTPLTGGVLWNVQDTMIEEIDRIEVLRGPGGVTWGANAFNAVINIITKRASQTGGMVASTALALDGGKMAAARLGDAEGSLKWRAFAKYSDGDENADALGVPMNDDWSQARIGGRVEASLSELDQLQLNSEAYSGEFDARIFDTETLVASPWIRWSSLPTVDIDEKVEGTFAGARFTRDLGNGSRLNVDASGSYYNLDSALMSAHGVTGEVNVQHVASRWGRHLLSSGLMVLAAEDHVGDGDWRISRPEISSWRVGGFVQDELTFFDDLLVSIGAKLEYSDATGVDAMPSLRALYAFDTTSNVWAAISRGVRAPALTEHHGRLGGGPQLAPLTAVNPTPVPIRGELWGVENMQTEKVTAYELGVRHDLSPVLRVDLAVFYNDFEGLRGPGETLPLTCEPSGVAISQNPLCVFGSTHLLAAVEITNVYDTSAYGGELVLTYAPLSNWRLLGSYSRISHHRKSVDLPIVDSTAFGETLIGGFDPTHQFALRSSLNLGRGWDIDAQWRYVDGLKSEQVPDYRELNVRAAWRPTPHFEVALAGSNLLHDRHFEFGSDFGEIAPVWIEREISVQARWMY